MRSYNRMSNLSYPDKKQLERLFEMGGGYVMDFTNQEMAEFFQYDMGINIYDEKYSGNGDSKAKRLREFWRLEDDQTVGKATEAMIKMIEEDSNRIDPNTQKLIDNCKLTVARLLSSPVNLNNLSDKAITLDAPYLAEQIRRMEQSVDTDPELAIGTAKELIETVCKTILSERGKPVQGTPNIPALTKATLKELNLVPEGIHAEARGSNVIRRILNNLGSIGNDLAELRGLYGTGHGRDGRAGGLSTRHAKFAVGAASTLAVFLFETHEENKASTN